MFYTFKIINPQSNKVKEQFIWKLRFKKHDPVKTYPLSP